MSQNSQSPSWGAPVSGGWGSPAVNAGAGRNSPNNHQTPVHHDRDVPNMNRSNSYPYSYRGGPNHNSSPRGNFTPRHFQPRPRYQSSPLSNAGTPNPRYSFHNSPQDFSPSPRHHGNNSFGSPRRPFPQRDRSFNNNPGGSDNINEYIHPSMLEDPWKDLQPKPMFRQY